MTTTGSRTDTEKSRALRAIAFELRQMAHATRLYRDNQATDGDPMAGNAYLDSSALHARALIDFFTKTTWFKTDIRRTEFAPEWTPTPTTAVSRISKDQWMLNKYLAHLTWERATPGGQEWNYPDLAEDVFAIAEAWCNHLRITDGDLADHFTPQIASARAALTS